MPNRKQLALGLTVIGALLIATGVTLIFVPAGFIVAGAIVLTVGLLGVDFD